MSETYHPKYVVINGRGFHAESDLVFEKQEDKLTEIRFECCIPYKKNEMPTFSFKVYAITVSLNGVVHSFKAIPSNIEPSDNLQLNIEFTPVNVYKLTKKTNTVIYNE